MSKPPGVRIKIRCLITSVAQQASVGRAGSLAGLLPLPLPLLLLLLLASLADPCRALVQVPNRHTLASIPGDLVVGILIPVHERPEPKQAQTGTCGAVREQYGIQRVEAAFRTIDSINADPTILPNITLGLEVRDSCWHSPIALEQSIEFIRDAMAASEQNQLKAPATQLQLQQPQISSTPAVVAAGGPGEPLAGNASSVCAPLLLRQQQQLQAQKKVKNVVGVVGPASSGDTVQVQNLLQMFSMPQVGYSATSRDLSNKNFYKYFLRVVPSDKLQARVLIDLMLAHNWTYITVAYTEGSYGASLMNAFRERAQEVGICFATLESMPPNADDAKFDELIEAIQKHPNARVVICMCEGRTVSKLFSGFKRKNIINEYLVVGSDGWSDRFDVVERREDFALGGISIRIHSAYVHDFDDHYFALNPFTNHRNPWFAEFWETRFQCNLADPQPNSSHSLAGQPRPQQATSASGQRPFGARATGGKVYNRTCTGRESLRNNHKQDAKMAFVQKSIITMALGLDSMQRAICPPNKPGLCPEMLPVNGSTLIQHLMNVSFSFLGEEVHFDEQGDPPGKYEILNFQRRRPYQHYALQPAANYDRPPFPNGSALDPLTDYSVASAASGTATDSETLAQKRRLNPLYDSYSTLRVYRPPAAAAAAATTGRVSRAAGTGRPGGSHQQVQPQPQQHPPASGYSSTSGYEYVLVGSWKSSDGLSLFGEIQWPSGGLASDEFYAGSAAFSPPLSPPDGPTRKQQQEGGGRWSLPKSVCSLPCAKGHAKKIQSDSVKCCWVCVPCRPNEYLFNETKCQACEKGWWPNSVQTGCDQIPIQYLDWRSADALTAICIAVFGLVLTLATAVVFVRHNNTPVVKSTTRELSYMILFAMFLCYLNTFFLVSKPSRLSCFVTRVLPGFAFAMMYGALVTKTNRIARILAGSKKKIITRRPRFMSGTSQVAITWIIVLIECLIIVFMLVREPADKMHDYPSDVRVVLVCNTTTMGIIAPLGFDFFLIAMCTLYAFKTRNVPENFNEAKFIGFTMYTTLVIWVAFVAIYLSSDHKVTTLCLCISFSALFALVLLFFPRCYIIIFKPEKNNRSFFTTTKNVRCHIGYQIGSTGAAAAAAAHLSSAGGGGQLTASCATNSTTTSGNTTNGAHHAGFFLAAANSIDSDHSATNNFEPRGHHQQQQQEPDGHFSPGPQPPMTRSRTSGPVLDSYQPPGGRYGGCQTGADAATRLSQRSAFSERFSIPNAGSKPGWSSAGRSSDPFHSERHLAPGGALHAPQQQQQQQRPAGLGSLLERFLLVFSNRSRRKESDKASSIQQHLRAIRHAENLDRQTHFRRSQVQRSLQRFDSGAQMTAAEQSLIWSTTRSTQHQHQRQSLSYGPTSGNPAAANNLLAAGSGWPQQPSGQLELMAAHGQWRREEAERLLCLLSQLIGPANVLRLADRLRRHWQVLDVGGGRCAGQELLLVVGGQGRDEAETEGSAQPALDLNQLGHRRLAINLLGTLGELVRRSMDEIRLRDSQASSKCQLRNDGAGVAGCHREADTDHGPEGDRCDTRTRTGEVCKLSVDSAKQQTSGSKSLPSPAAAQVRHQNYARDNRIRADRPAAAAVAGESLAGSGALQTSSVQPDEQTDPIKRALDNIMGRELQARSARLEVPTKIAPRTNSMGQAPPPRRAIDAPRGLISGPTVTSGAAAAAESTNQSSRPDGSSQAIASRHLHHQHRRARSGKSHHESAESACGAHVCCTLDCCHCSSYRREATCCKQSLDGCYGDDSTGPVNCGPAATSALQMTSSRTSSSSGQQTDPSSRGASIKRTVVDMDFGRNRHVDEAAEPGHCQLKGAQSISSAAAATDEPAKVAASSHEQRQVREGPGSPRGTGHGCPLELPLAKKSANKGPLMRDGSDPCGPPATTSTLKDPAGPPNIATCDSNQQRQQHHSRHHRKHHCCNRHSHRPRSAHKVSQGDINRTSGSLIRVCCSQLDCHRLDSAGCGRSRSRTRIYLADGTMQRAPRSSSETPNDSRVSPEGSEAKL